MFELSPQVLHFLAKTKLSSVCRQFFFFYLYTLLQNEFKEINFYLQGDFIIVLIIFDKKSHHFSSESFLHDQIRSKMSAFFDGER